MNQSPYAERKALHNGSLTIVSRGVRAADGTPVVLKRLRQLYPPPASITALRRELALTRQAACAGVVEALELSEAQGVVSLVFKDFGGSIANGQSVGQRLDAASSLDSGPTIRLQYGVIEIVVDLFEDGDKTVIVNFLFLGCERLRCSQFF